MTSRATIRPVVFLLIAGAALSGLVAGVIWHRPLAGVVGAGETSPAGGEGAATAKRLWTCSMHPQVIQDHPGLCPICHMELTPLRTEPGAGAAAPSPGHPGSMPAITIEPAVVQNMGVRTARATAGTLTRQIRAAGTITEAEPRIIDINARVSGWVEALHADTEGMPIHKGDPLFDLSSPELTVAIEELIQARRAGGDPQSPTARLADAGRRKLALYGLMPEQIDALAALDGAPRTIAFSAPASGDLTRKSIVRGAAVKPGDTLLRISDRSVVWLDAAIYQRDLPLVHVGQPVTATVASMPGRALSGEVSLVSPTLDPMTRSATVRIAIANEDLALRPGMFATAVLMGAPTEPAIVIPREAVIDTGVRQVVMVWLGQGRFAPHDVTVGLEDGGMVQVLTGIADGDLVVTSGQFLFDSESRLKEAIQKLLGGEPGGPSARAAVDAAVSPIRVDAEAQARIDALVMAYLALAESLGAPEKPGASAPDIAPLELAADALAAHLHGGTSGPLADRVSTGAADLRRAGREQSRESFKEVSAAIIALVQRHPPSVTVAPHLFRVHCPMAPGDWLQRSEEVANPYYATTMKACGEVVGTIAPAAPEGHR